MLRLLSLVSFFFFLTACAGTDIKDVQGCGEGIYAVSASANHPYGNYVTTSRKAALAKANTFCRSKDKQLLVENINEGFLSSVTFRCLAEGDPELQQSDHQHKPAATVQNPCN
jgi:hypothetical protein